jgi:uncharacterized OB-fold protein
MPVPRPTRTLRGAHDIAFWAYCQKGELTLQRCVRCKTYAWPPVEVCEACGSDELPWCGMSGRGWLRSFCTFERQYYPECAPPWTVVLVELEEGPLFISNARAIAEQGLEEGVELSVEFLDCEDGNGVFALPVFSAHP